MSIGAMVIELRIFNKKKKNMDKMGKLFVVNFAQNWYFSERFGTQLIFDMYFAGNSLKVKET